jgi:hypothetical protein
MLDSFLSEYVMRVDQLARSSTEQVRLRSAGSDALAQLLHLRRTASSLSAVSSRSGRPSM